MKKITSYFMLLFVAVTVLSSFTNKTQTNDNPTEFELLVQYLEENGNFINTAAPALVLADEIKDNVKNDKYLVLDIRSEGWFDYGHIKNAKNAKGPELLNYFKNEINPADYEKITIVCYSGQSAAYYASLLRLYGFDNVYSLKWGMSSWAEELAQNVWVKNSKNQFDEQLETTANEMPAACAPPTIKTGKETAEEILKTRIEEAFAKPYKEFITKAEAVFENPADFYVVNYVDEACYNFAHVPGAVKYTPKESLASTAHLLTLPTNKKIVVNSETGQEAAYAVAYLHILGYDVANLAYGANSFMNQALIDKGWDGFSSEEIKNYTLTE
ncbi:MAG TPA: rhodanese-like domain-containing protein [Flavobacteriaceae bacterium]|nr:rhodanese-like domain-containing protein [Flavobacteriaceae bacterium]